MAGTLLTKRDTFLNRAQTMQLMYAACTATQVRHSCPQVIRIIHHVMPRRVLQMAGRNMHQAAYRRGLETLHCSKSICGSAHRMLLGSQA